MGLPDFFKNESPCIFAASTGSSVILGPVSSESESGSVKISDNAVEDGTTISDHIFKDPESIDVKTFLCDNNDLASKALNAAKSAAGLTVDKLKVSDKLSLLKYWRDSGEIVTYSGPVFSGLLKDGYDITADSMVITKIDASRSLGNGEGLDVSIGLRKIVIAQALMKNAKMPKDAKARTKKGTSTVKTDKTDAKPNSVMQRIFGADK